MFACIYNLYITYVQCSQKPKEDIRFYEIGITDDQKPPCGCYESDQGPLQEQPALLAAEPSLQPQPRPPVSETLL